MHSSNKRPWIVKRGEKSDLKLSTPVIIEASIVAADRGNERSLRLKFQNENMETETIDVPAASSVKGSGAEMLAALRKSGVLFSEEGGKFLVAMVRENQPTHAIHQYERAGFHGNLFITPAGQPINSNVAVELAPEKKQKGISQSGSLEGWVSAVANVVGHFHLSLGVTFAFTGPLADLLGLDTHIVFYTGETTRGKTTSQLLGASAWGAAKVGQGQTISCRSTVNALEGHMERASGSYLAVDDGNHMLPAQLKELVYMGASGNGKSRLDQHSKAKAVRTWRTCVTVSDEVGFAQRLRSEKSPFLAV